MGLQQDDVTTQKRRARRWVIGMMLFSGALIALMLLGQFIVKTFSIDQVQQARQGLRAFGAWWMYVRWAFIAGLIIYWVDINTWLARRKGWSEAHLARVLNGRWFTLGVLLFVEMFFVLRIHEPLIDRWLQ